MANYLLTYYGGGMPETQEEQAQVMRGLDRLVRRPRRQARRRRQPDRGVEGDLARRLGDDLTQAPSGYSIIKAADLNAAVESAKDCPVKLGGASILVSEVFEVM